MKSKAEDPQTCLNLTEGVKDIDESGAYGSARRSCDRSPGTGATEPCLSRGWQKPPGLQQCLSLIKTEQKQAHQGFHNRNP